VVWYGWSAGRDGQTDTDLDICASFEDGISADHGG
jgi:hypothetical protein